MGHKSQNGRLFQTFRGRNRGIYIAVLTDRHILGTHFFQFFCQNLGQGALFLCTWHLALAGTGLGVQRNIREKTGYNLRHK